MTLDELYGVRGRTAIVTGGASGIGRAIAQLFASQGIKVIIGDIDEDGAAETVERIIGAGGNAIAMKLDQADPGAITNFMAAADSQHGPITILVNNAAYQHRAYFDDTTAALWDKLYAINLRGPFLLIQEFARKLKKRGERGRVVNVSSLGAVLTIDESLTAYNSLKAAVSAMTRHAALELGPHGIAVNAILPGGTPTKGALTSEGPAPSEQLMRRFPPPIGRMATAEDMAGPALFLASEAASFITGQGIIVDGGFSIV